jgi:hypothetical protein
MILAGFRIGKNSNASTENKQLKATFFVSFENKNQTAYNGPDGLGSY